MNAGHFERLRKHISENLPHIRSVLVVRHGYLVFEEYFQGLTPNDYQMVASVTKSFTSALIGIAIEKRLLLGGDQSIYEFFSDYDIPNHKSRIQGISIKHLLTMTAGFGWSDADSDRWLGSNDLVGYALGLPIAYAPGQQFNYCTPGTHLLSVILTRAAGMRASDFADEHLFRPLGISRHIWPADVRGNNFGGHGISMLSRDLAKFGYLYLNNGHWENRQIIPAEWVEESTQRHNSGGLPEGENYGYSWWITTVKGHPAYFAGGFGGQFIYVIPALDTVVVITSSPDRPHMENRRIVGDFIVPAVSE